MYLGGMVLGQRLAASRKKAGLTQVELAVEMGDRYDQTMISHVESGRSALVTAGLARAAQALRVSTDYLLGLTDDPTPAVDRNGDRAASGHDFGSPMSEQRGHTSATTETKPAYNLEAAWDQDGIWNLPLREVRPAAGSGAEVFAEEVVGYVPFRKDWLAQHSIDPAQADVVQVSGDSMEPTLPDGCSILVDRSRQELQPKRIYVLRNEDGLVVKRVDRNRDGWWVVSDNPAWLPVSLTDETDIIGEVRWTGRTL